MASFPQHQPPGQVPSMASPTPPPASLDPRHRCPLAEERAGWGGVPEGPRHCWGLPWPGIRRQGVICRPHSTHPPCVNLRTQAAQPFTQQRTYPAPSWPPLPPHPGRHGLTSPSLMKAFAFSLKIFPTNSHPHSLLTQPNTQVSPAQAQAWVRQTCSPPSALGRPSACSPADGL